MAKGYQALGTFRLAANRRDLRLASTSPPDAGHRRDTPETSNAVPALYWRWRPTGGVETARRRVLDTACTEIIAGLAAVGWTLPGCSPDGAGWLRHLVGRQPGHPSRGRAVNRRRKPLIAFFLLLARRGGVILVDESGVTEWPAELPVEAAILETWGCGSGRSEPTAHRFRWRYLVLLKYHPRADVDVRPVGCAWRSPVILRSTSCNRLT